MLADKVKLFREAAMSSDAPEARTVLIFLNARIVDDNSQGLSEEQIVENAAASMLQMATWAIKAAEIIRPGFTEALRK
ncbi:MAG: hypothetical protein HY921_03655 [Elusimicrobia bacterium]|nr:hypothetical protein [Elusimicrobiota bacterium]